MRRACLAPLLLLVGACAATPEPLAEPFDVLLLGDSISIGYTPHVRAALEGRARVVRPMNASGRGAQNCQGTNHGVQRLEDWLVIDGGGWEVIHFNFGLHDLKRVEPGSGSNSKDPGHPHQAEPERYEAQLRELTERLQETGARLVFASTTPVPPQVGGPYRAPEDALVYNAIAARVMGDMGVPIDDLFAFVAAGPDGWQKPRDVHFTAEGSRALGGEVARVILRTAGH
jgi:lysophospholipase L1-like esterase